MAVAATGLGDSHASWNRIAGLGDFSFDRVARYFFYFFFLGICYSTLFSVRISNLWIYAFFTFVVIPFVLSLLPFAFTEGLTSSSYWGVSGILCGFYYWQREGIGGKFSKIGMFALLAFLIFYTVITDTNNWESAFFNVAQTLDGDLSASEMTEHSFAYFAFPEFLKAALSLFFYYFLQKALLNALHEKTETIISDPEKQQITLG
jgi:hypothetical protein